MLHATPSLGETLKHVRSLVAPDGRLLLLELLTAAKSVNYLSALCPAGGMASPTGVLTSRMSHQTDGAKSSYAQASRRLTLTP